MTTPSWVTLLADDGLVSAKELAQWLGVHMTTLRNRVKAGTLPKPSHFMKHHHGMKSHRWKVLHIREYLKTHVVNNAEITETICGIGSQGQYVGRIITVQCACCFKVLKDVCAYTKYCPECLAIVTSARRSIVSQKKLAARGGIPVKRGNKKGTLLGPQKRRYET